MEPDSSMDLGDETANAFLADLIGEDEAAGGKKPEADRETPESTEEEHEEEGQETEEEDEAEGEPAKDAKEADPDDVEVDLGENSKAKMRDLKAAFRLQAETNAAREQATELRAQADAQAALAKAALSKGLEKAEARWKPYAGLDFLALSRDPSIDTETFAAIRKEAADALADVKFHREELQGVVTAQQQEVQQRSKAEAAATVAALSNPETGIKGWNQQLYNEMLSYAEKSGAPKGMPQQMTAEWALRCLHKAMLYDQGVKATQSKIEKVVNKPTRVLSSSKGDGKVALGSGVKSAMAALRKSGDVDDAADAFFQSAQLD